MLNWPQDHFQLKFQNAANPILNQQKKKKAYLPLSVKVCLSRLHGG